MQASLFVKLAATLTAVMVLAVSLAAYLNQVRVRQTYMTMVAQRLDVVLEDAYRDLLVGLTLDLHPEAMERLPQTLERALAIMPDTRALRVLDCDGGLVAMAGTASGQPPAWRDRLGEAHWVSLRDDTLATGRTLTDTLGDCAGSLVVEMAAAPHRAALDRMAGRLWRGAALSLLLLLPLLGGLALVLRRRNAMIGHLGADLEALAASPAPAEAAPDLTPRHALTESEARMVAAYREARRAFAADAGPRS